MPKLTVLIFSKDDNRQALGLIKDVYDIADEIVLMDGSGAKDRRFMIRERKRLGLTKLKIHDIIAIGYREPFMMYGFTKCSNRWILYFDTDERPSEQLKRDVRRLISDDRYDAYAIGVHSVRSRTDENFVSWQFMLFKKDKMEFRGVLHERAVCHGRFTTLTDPNYRINQMVTGMVHSAKGRYAEMERFQRYTYAQHNMRVLEQLDRVGTFDYNVSTMTSGKKALLALLRIYEALGLKRQDEEISNFDYWAFWLSRTLAHQMRRGSLAGMLNAVRDSFTYIGQMKGWRSGPHADEDFEIAKLIERYGVTKFLGIDRPDVVKELNREYMSKQQGIELLINLIRERYNRSKGIRG
ncbi:MAG: hypothetical protein KGH60_05210 [Candidatus Micrarchaeota archaeon]|nr:hypothetical protein [Candidatus Micrarchaeota archaeon]